MRAAWLFFGLCTVSSAALVRHAARLRCRGPPLHTLTAPLRSPAAGKQQIHSLFLHHASRYSKLYQAYKLAVQSAHFGPNALTQAGTPLWEWKDPTPVPTPLAGAAGAGAPASGIAACAQPPLLRFLAAPRLAPELAQFLAPQPKH